MGNRKILFLVGPTVVLLAALFVYATRERDPVYEGKRLSEHLETIRANGFQFYGMEMPPEPGVLFESPDQRALEAISKVGANALPMLARMLKSRDSRVGLWMRALIRKNPGLGTVTYIRPEREQDILSLTKVLRVQTPYQNGVSKSQLHSLAILALSQFGARASGAVPLLLDNLTKTNEQVQAASAVALARIGAPPEKVVPLILEYLPKTNPPPSVFGAGRSFRTVQMMETGRDLSMNIWALGEYGRHASNALPILSNLVRYPDSRVRNASVDAAAKIRGERGR